MDPGHRRRTPPRAAGALILFAWLALASPGGAAREPAFRPPPLAARAASMQARIEAIARRWIGEAARRSGNAAHPGNVRVAVAARALEPDVELVALGADRAMRPASNMKLVTTAAALVLLGGGQEFVTPFEALGPVEGGVLHGDLVVRAAGDPLCAADGDPRVEPRLGAVARRIRAAGIAVVEGDLLLDEGTFAAPAPGPGWPDPHQRWTEYCALAGGFTVNGGVLVAEVRPGAVGTRARVEVHPSPHGLASRYDVRTTGGATLDVRVGATASAVTVKGELPHRKRFFRAEFSHPDPVELFASVLRAQLAEAGITLRGKTRRVRGAAVGTRVAELRSAVDDTLGPINAESRNGVADQLFLAVGNTVVGLGTREGGSEATRRALRRLGVGTEGFHQVDGSGLSRDDRVTARQITSLLASVLARDDETARLFRESLAVAGERGTLAKRMEKTAARGRVRAKTGWIAGTSALSGLAETLDGRRVVFSILVEYPPSVGGLNTACFKPMQDEMATLFVEGGP